MSMSEAWKQAHVVKNGDTDTENKKLSDIRAVSLAALGLPANLTTPRMVGVNATFVQPTVYSGMKADSRLAIRSIWNLLIIMALVGHRRYWWLCCQRHHRMA